MIHLFLSVEETNLVLKHLGNAPYVEVAQLIQKIHTISAQQLAEIAAKDAAYQRNEEIRMNPPMAASAGNANGAALIPKENDGPG